MKRRQTSVPAQWLITDDRLGDVREAIRRLPRGSGVLVRHHHLAAGDRARLLSEIRRLARARGLQVTDEADGSLVRVHDASEIRQAGLGRAAILLLSPLHETRSHPGRRPLPRMRAAALARLARQPVLALGGMDRRRFRTLKSLGDDGWAAIDGWLGVSRSRQP